MAGKEKATPRPHRLPLHHRHKVLVVALAWIIQLARPPTEDLTTQRREEPTIQAREDLTTQPREEPTIQAREEPTTQPREDPIIQPREEQTIPPMGQEKTTT